MTMSPWVDWSIGAKAAAVGAVLGALATIGDATTGLHIIGGWLPWVTRDEINQTLDARKSIRDKELKIAQDAVADDISKIKNEVTGLGAQITDIREQSLSWRVADYPTKIINLQANVASLELQLADVTSFPLRQTLTTQIRAGNDQIEILKKAQARDSCLLSNVNRFVPFLCPP